MQRRRFLQILSGALIALSLRTDLRAQGLVPGRSVLIWCLGRGQGRNRYLDGNTANASVSLVPQRQRPLSGMRWSVVRVSDGVVALKCLGDIEGNRWLDGNTVSGQVGFYHGEELRHGLGLVRRRLSALSWICFALALRGDHICEKATNSALL